MPAMRKRRQVTFQTIGIMCFNRLVLSDLLSFSITDASHAIQSLTRSQLRSTELLLASLEVPYVVP